MRDCARVLLVIFFSIHNKDLQIKIWSGSLQICQVIPQIAVDSNLSNNNSRQHMSFSNYSLYQVLKEKKMCFLNL